MSKLASWGSNMILHDTRLLGSPPSDLASNIYNFDGSVETSHILGWAGNYAISVGGLTNLFIMCHGYAGADPVQGVSIDAGGSGLQLGQDGLTLNNASLFSSLLGKVGSIFIYACAAADSSMAGDSIYFDGERLMTEIASNSGGTVIAANKIQWYNGSTGIIDFGDWEGTVKAFSATAAPVVLPNNYRPS